MCHFPSNQVFPPDANHATSWVLWDPNRHSHTTNADTAGIDEDRGWKFEFNLDNFETKEDTGYVSAAPQWAFDMADRFFKERYGTPELLAQRVQELDVDKFTRWVDLDRILSPEDQRDLSPCPCPCRATWPAPCPFPCVGILPGEEPYGSNKPEAFHDWKVQWRDRWVKEYKKEFCID